MRMRPGERSQLCDLASTACGEGVGRIGRERCPQLDHDALRGPERDQATLGGHGEQRGALGLGRRRMLSPNVTERALDLHKSAAQRGDAGAAGRNPRHGL
jgi:hypothetical protein